MKRIALALTLSIVILATLLSLAAANPPALPESYKTRVALTATGATDVASGSVTTGYLRGYIRAVHIDYGAAVTSSTDITIARTSPAGTVMVEDNSATDAWYYPSAQFTGATGAAVSGAYGRFPVDDALTISAAQSTSGTVAVITIEYGD
jgi:hypothetical protein